MFHDQARTESLLMDSLEQLKKLFMCSYSTFQKTETEKEFKVCVNNENFENPSNQIDKYILSLFRIYCPKSVVAWFNFVKTK